MEARGALRPDGIAERKLYRGSSRTRGGGEAGSKTGGFTESGMPGVEVSLRKGAEITGGAGRTNMIAWVTVESAVWQHATVQSIAGALE